MSYWKLIVRLFVGFCRIKKALFNWIHFILKFFVMCSLFVFLYFLKKAFLSCILQFLLTPWVGSVQMCRHENVWEWFIWIITFDPCNYLCFCLWFSITEFKVVMDVSLLLIPVIPISFFHKVPTAFPEWKDEQSYIGFT